MGASNSAPASTSSTTEAMRKNRERVGAATADIPGGFALPRPSPLHGVRPLRRRSRCCWGLARARRMPVPVPVVAVGLLRHGSPTQYPPSCLLRALCVGAVPSASCLPALDLPLAVRRRRRRHLRHLRNLRFLPLAVALPFAPAVLA